MHDKEILHKFIHTMISHIHLKNSKIHVFLTIKKTLYTLESKFVIHTMRS